MGFWVDFDEAYWTMSPEYVESVWWSLKQIWDKGLLVQDHRVAPYCPRCGTGLSDHELAQGYETIKDPSVFVRFPATSGKLAELNATLLVWTTTPWTLIANTAIAVNPKVEYQVVEVTNDEKTERLVIASDLASVLGEDRKVIATFQGSELEHTTYKRPFDFVEIPNAHYVVLANYVTVEDGTGLVHQSPAFGADDLEVCRRYNLPVVNPVNPDAVISDSYIWSGGWAEGRAKAYGITVAELPAYYAKRTLLNEIILPDDIANACYAFVGGLLNKSTGNALNVDGGVSMGFYR